MAEFVAFYILPAVFVLTYLLQLWSGFAVAGISGDQVLVDRRTRPGPYWFIMAIQTMILVVAPILVGMWG
ncbi:hypothetical protein [Allorhodopirellula solitaria]|uniref:Uncharacterized protein n=1 Tax=Allorhodopirellula solitaria TaxID=2527987 RepID=A0A5C5XRT2_9BACT|nr:hypothetical protein [Allorhodopirellula solitaria]TWT65083.1 hypothetical protein CA85_34280 [Allorhodopirellula solitaria]